MTISCFGRDSRVREFEVKWSRDPNGTKQVFVSTIPPLEDGSCFEATYQNVGESTFRQTMISNQGLEEYSQKGIPDSLIPFLAELWGCRIESSPVDFSEPGVWQTNKALKMWARLIDKKIAELDECNGVCFVVQQGLEVRK